MGFIQGISEREFKFEVQHGIRIYGTPLRLF